MFSSDAVLERAAELKSQGIPFVLATVVRCESPTSAKPGAKGIVDAEGTITGWIGGGCAQPAVIAVAKKALADGQPRLIRVSPVKGGQVEEGILDFGMICHSGGTLDIFLEPFAARPSLLIIGASPAAQALAGLAERTGYDVFVASAGADADSFPNARQVIDGTDLAALACGSPDCVVVATQGKRDEAGLEAALGTGARYVAFIASERKAAKLRTYLRERGHDPVRVDAVVSPAGIEIGAVTPEEIALSVLAGIVKARRDGSIVGQSQPVTPRARKAVNAGSNTPSSAASPRAAGSAIDPVCGMSVEIAAADFRTEYQGTTYFFCCAGCQHRFEKEPEPFLARARATVQPPGSP
jgi:xanthine dehydrogenase accessory factor